MTHLRDSGGRQLVLFFAGRKRRSKAEVKMRALEREIGKIGFSRLLLDNVCLRPPPPLSHFVSSQRAKRATPIIPAVPDFGANFSFVTVVCLSLQFASFFYLSPLPLRLCRPLLLRLHLRRRQAVHLRPLRPRASHSFAASSLLAAARSPALAAASATCALSPSSLRASPSPAPPLATASAAALRRAAARFSSLSALASEATVLERAASLSARSEERRCLDAARAAKEGVVAPLGAAARGAAPAAPSVFCLSTPGHRLTAASVLQRAAAGAGLL